MNFIERHACSLVWMIVACSWSVAAGAIGVPLLPFAVVWALFVGVIAVQCARVDERYDATRRRTEQTVYMSTDRLNVSELLAILAILNDLPPALTDDPGMRRLREHVARRLQQKQGDRS